MVLLSTSLIAQNGTEAPDPRKERTAIQYGATLVNPKGLAFSGLGSLVVFGLSTLTVWLTTSHIQACIEECGNPQKTVAHHIMQNGLHSYAAALFTAIGVASANQAWQSFLSAWQNWYVTPDDFVSVKVKDLGCG